ncbi:hypothetical protein M413DRAFT_422982 [Hebeloma cylindrosporum]|uniref:F-box domain-containing protein n=1 Tax=Hebeloma cylindrosporum TaxID=76867 RepID=A0A0C3CEL8_HEBCY|nr:hypothetical protein M413DRAFT_422982 [Hebeloma cylindrosporum h7]
MSISNQGSVVGGALLPSIPPTYPNFPNDVLKRIFDLIIRGPAVFPPPSNHPREILAQVCTRWQYVVTSTPTYWTTLEFVQLDAQGPANFFELAQEFLRRSGSTIPLSIRFRGGLESDAAHRIFEHVIQSYAHRMWFFACVITKRELGTFFGADCVQFPLLLHVVLDVSTADAQISTRIPVRGSVDISAFQHALPSLRHVVLSIPEGIHATDLQLPWSRLTDIDLGNTPIRSNKFMKIMEQSLVLDDGVFCINFPRIDSEQSITFRTITVPLLRHLRLRLIRPSRGGRTFPKLRTPSLESLWLEREEVGQAVRDTRLYETLLAGLNASLKHITITEHSVPSTLLFLPQLKGGPRFMYQGLEGVLRSAHNLTSLYLYPGIFIHPVVLGKLASGEFLPFLEKLAISSVTGWDIIWMVQERNLVSTRPHSGGPSSELGSLAAPMVRRAVPLNYLSLLVMGCGLDQGSVQKLKHAVGSLRLACGYVLRYVDIPSREPIYPLVNHNFFLFLVVDTWSSSC